MSAPRIAVVGAGLSGLTCALDLKDRGFDVEVLEREPTVGGRMNTRSWRGCTDLQRWPSAIPRLGGEQVARVARFWSQGQGENGVWLAGDYMNHPWLEGATLCGARVADRVTQAFALSRLAPCGT